MPFFWLKPLIVAGLSIGVYKAANVGAKIDRMLMGVFRDLGRYKARKRRLGKHSDKGLIVTLFRRDDPLQDFVLQQNDDHDMSNLPTYTTQELFEFGNGQDDNPILIAIMGHVYDVSLGERFYGPEGRYHLFAGHDITYALSTGCRAHECVETRADRVQDEKQLREGKRWLSFFHMHDKYPLVGKLEGDYFETILNELLLEEDASSNDGVGEAKISIF